MDEIERYLQPIEVINFFVDNRSQTTNHHDLIKHFRPLLVESSLASENHALLKKITAKIIVVKKLHGNKFLEMKPEFQGLTAQEILKTIEIESEQQGESNFESFSLVRNRGIECLIGLRSVVIFENRLRNEDTKEILLFGQK